MCVGIYAIYIFGDIFAHMLVLRDNETVGNTCMDIYWVYNLSATVIDGSKYANITTTQTHIHTLATYRADAALRRYIYVHICRTCVVLYTLSIYSHKLFARARHALPAVCRGISFSHVWWHFFIYKKIVCPIDNNKKPPPRALIWLLLFCYVQSARSVPVGQSPYI